MRACRLRSLPIVRSTTTPRRTTSSIRSSAICTPASESPLKCSIPSTPAARAFLIPTSECAWARVLVYEPPNRVVLSWDINLEWKIETDSTRASEVEVRFVAETPTRTRVELEHRHLVRHGDGWEQMRDAVGSDGGWTGVLGHFVDRMKR